MTHALGPASDALDQIGNGENGCGDTVPADQRGVSRPQNGACDIGAYEKEGLPVPTLGHWGASLLAILVGGTALWRMRRRR